MGVPMNSSLRRADPLVHFSLRLRRDQADFLETVSNKSGFVRDAIDEAMARHEAASPEDKRLQTVMRIRILEGRLDRLNKDQSRIDAVERIEKHVGQEEDEATKFLKGIIKVLEADGDSASRILDLMEFLGKPELEGLNRESIGIDFPTESGSEYTVIGYERENWDEAVERILSVARRRISELVGEEPDIDYYLGVKETFDAKIADYEAQIETLKNVLRGTVAR